jgi:hypothetical protein
MSYIRKESISPLPYVWLNSDWSMSRIYILINYPVTIVRYILWSYNTLPKHLFSTVFNLTLQHFRAQTRLMIRKELNDPLRIKKKFNANFK